MDFADLAEAATHAHVIEWLRKVGRRFLGLQGGTVVRWSGVEMALRDHGDDGAPQFEDPDVPFVRLLSLDLELASGCHHVTCAQNDDIFGLFVEGSTHGPAEFDGIYRMTDDLDAPVGSVERVEVTVEDDVVAEVELTIDGQRMLVVAGEVEEGPGTLLRMRRLDESVLLFPDAADAERLVWIPSRPGQARQGGIE